MPGAGLGWPTGEPTSLRRFPRRTLAVGTLLHRVHRRDRTPWWFATIPENPTMGGRFDLAHPHGTCYTTLSSPAALLEVFRRRSILVEPAEEVDRRLLTTARLPRSLSAANATAKRASAFGVTGEFHSTLSYPKTRAWAARLHDAGFTALLSIPHHDPRQALRTLALFDHAGEHPPFGWRWPTRTNPLGAEAMTMLNEWGVRVAPIPTDVPTTQPPPA